MGKKLAIKGHSTRGKEVIELLEMMGGNNVYNIMGNNDETFYYIDDKNNIDYDWTLWNNNYCTVFTLEEFLAQYPYKIGDKVADGCGNLPTIKSMAWSEDYETMVYDFEDSNIVLAAEDLKTVNMYKPLFKAGDVVKLKGCPDKNLFWIVMDVVKDGYIFNDGKKYPFDDQHHYEKSNREVMLTTPTTPSKMKNILAELLEHIKTTPKDELEREFEEIKEWSNVGPTIEEFMTFCECVNKQSKYPTTYEECNRIMCVEHWNTLWGEDATKYEEQMEDLINTLIRLKVCRDAYWKIYSEEMGLEKTWEPDWNEETNKFTISNKCNKIYLNNTAWYAEVLSFPTAEMRDAFYENFKDLIEQCKELL